MDNAKSTTLADEAVKFLERDFTQCFEQMRHYDSQIIDLGKFAYTSYPVVVGAAAGIYKYGLDTHVDLSRVAGVIPLIAFFPGLFLLWHMVRTRVYFVHVTRYVNEHRKVFLNLLPQGSFPNESEMWNEPKKPQFLDRYSSQLYFMCILAILNSFLGGVAAYLFLAMPLAWAGVVFGGLLIVQVVGLVHQLCSVSKQNIWTLFGLKPALDPHARA